MILRCFVSGITVNADIEPQRQGGAEDVRDELAGQDAVIARELYGDQQYDEQRLPDPVICR